MSNPPKASLPVSPNGFVIDRKSNGRAIYDPQGKQASMVRQSLCAEQLRQFPHSM